jgi:hypothetical protein
MNLIDFCEELGEKLNLPENLHVAAVFKNNSESEILGWAILDKNNNKMSSLIETENLVDWEKYLLHSNDCPII